MKEKILNFSKKNLSDLSALKLNTIIHIVDSDVIKAEGYIFESLDIVRDGFRSTPEKSVYDKGYHVAEVCVLTNSNHLVSIFSEIHSSIEKRFQKHRN